MKIKCLNLSWIFFVSKRFARVDRKGRSAVTSTLSTLGICFGVMTLIVVMSVMNGFQMSFIDSILEISSYHLRVQNLTKSEEVLFTQFCNENKKIKNCSPFYEAQALMTSFDSIENSVIIRAVDNSIFEKDAGLKKEAKIVYGKYDLFTENSIILGYSLARNLDVFVGDTVNLLVMSGGSDVDLFSQDRQFTVTGIFSSGYAQINNSFCFVNLQSANQYFGENSKKIYGIKLKNYNDDLSMISNLKKIFPNAKIESWKEYNKTFFGALRIEKNMLLLLVALIFVVVTINIFNGMRRLVFERKSEIAILQALGSKKTDTKLIFIFRGFLMGLIGSVLGLIFGILISKNTDLVFIAISKIMYFFQFIFTTLFNRDNLEFIHENSTYLVYASIPSRIFWGETVAIFCFGVFAPLFASYKASKGVLENSVAQILHTE